VLLLITRVILELGASKGSRRARLEWRAEKEL